MSTALPFLKGIGYFSHFLSLTIPLASQLVRVVTAFGILPSPEQYGVNALAGWITYCIR
jgi:hypothetical protein